MEDYKEFLNSEYVLSPVLESFYKEGTAFDNWILGFINGEGCFHIHNKGHLVFYIEHTDKNSLDLIKKRYTFFERTTRKSSIKWG
jgi:cupin superfamily acireductone dioxygenase involved in methionine salvage